MFDVLNETKRVSVSKLFCSLIVSFMIMVTKNSVLIEPLDIWADSSKNYFKVFDILDWILFILLIAIIYIIFNVVLVLLRKVNIRMDNKRIYKKSLICITFVFIFFCWLPYYLIAFPGGVYSDTYSILAQAVGEVPLDNHHPILYTLLIRLCGMIFRTSDKTVLCGIFILFQLIIMVSLLTYICYWLMKKRIKPQWIVLTILIFALFPFFPLNAVSMWKDTLFCIVIACFSLVLLDYCFDQNINKSFIVRYILFGVLVAFLRNNGKLIFILTTIIIVIYEIFKRKKINTFCILSVLFSLAVLIIQGPVYDKYNLNTDEAVESFAVPLQQIASVIENDRELTSEQETILFQLCSEEDWKNYYIPCIFDNLKWNAPTFNKFFLNDHERNIIKIWLQLLPKNLDLYVSSYIMEVNSYLNLANTFGAGAQYCADLWLKDGPVSSYDILKDKTGLDLKDNINSFPNLNESWTILIFIISLCLILNIDKKFIFFYLPSLFGILSILVATPLASSFRYIFFLALLFPLWMILPCYVKGISIHE